MQRSLFPYARKSFLAFNQSRKRIAHSSQFTVALDSLYRLLKKEFVNQSDKNDQSVRTIKKKINCT